MAHKEGKKPEMPEVTQGPQRIWAPWRLQYILDPVEGPVRSSSKEQKCVFCNRKKPAKDPEIDRKELILLRGDHCYMILNKYPYNNGHLMIIPFEHFSELEELDGETLLEIGLMAQKASCALKERLYAQGLNMGINLGKAAGAGIPGHLHWHVVPRWLGDHNFMPVISDTRILPEYNEKIYDRLKGAFER